MSLRNCQTFVLALTLFLSAPAFLQGGMLGQSTTYLSNLSNPVVNGLFTGANRFTAQAFVTGTDPRGYSLDFVKINVGGDGSPPGNFQVFLYSDNGGVPGTNLGQLSGPNPSGSGGGIFTYDTNGIGLSPATTYWILCKADAPFSGSDGYFWNASDQNNFSATDGWSISGNGSYSEDGGANWTPFGFVFFLEINAQVKAHIRVALVAAESGNPTGPIDVQTKLVATGRFDQVDIIDGSATTPTLAQLQAYTSVLVWSDYSFADDAALGNVLADYVDGGGGVVVAVFADASIPIQGRFASDDYYALEPAGQDDNTELTLGTIYAPSSPLMAGVIAFDGGTGSWRGTGSPNASAVRVADWSNGSPLIAQRIVNGTRRADLNFWPPSSDQRGDLWLSSTDGAKIMANALQFVANGTQCVPLPPDAIAWWRGDGNANDSAGAHNGSLLKGTTFGAGKVSQAFSFSGGSETVSVPNNSAWDFGSADFTIDAWAFLNADHAGNTFVAHERDVSSRWIFWTDVDNLEFFIADGINGNQNINVPFTPPIGQWFHVAVTRSGSTYKFYVDGVQIGSDVTNSIAVPAVDAPFTIGKSASDISLDGQLDEVEIFNRALTANEISNIFTAGSAGKCKCTPPPANMISWWPGEGNADDIQDGNSGNITGGVSFAAGEVNRGFDFDGATGFVDIGNPANLQLTSAITVDAWVRPDTTYGNYRTVISKWSQSANNSWGLFIANNTLYGYITAAGGSVSAAGGSIPFGPTAPFSHVAMTYSNVDGLRIYLNGAQVGASAGNGDIINGGDSVRMGNDTDLVPDRWFDGVIDEVEIFGRVLAVDEISAIYRASSAGKCRSCIPAPTGMVGWWPGDGDLTDIQGGHNGASNGGGPTFAAGEVGPAMDFDGVDDFFTAANVPDPNKAFTFDAWVYWRGPTGSGEQNLVEKLDGIGGASYLLAIADNGLVVSVIGGNVPGGLTFNTNDPIPANQWTHIAETDNGSTVNIYINGQLAASVTADRNTSSDLLYFGSGGSQFFLNGEMDEIEIYSRDLSPSEIQAIYDAGSGGKCKPAVPTDRQLANISARADVGTGDNVAIAGFIIQTDPSLMRTSAPVTPTKHLLIRGLGPSLTSLGGAALADPVLDLFNSQGNKIDHNDNWMEEPDGVNNPTRTATIQATGLAPSNANEAALLETLNSDSAYTVILSGKNGGTGIGLVEVYDLEATTTTHLHNLSTRAFVSTGDNVLIGGLIVQGDATTRILLRAIGPSLAGQGISNPLPDPVLELFDANGALIESNDNWGSSPEASDIIASGLAPSDSKESAILFAPAPGPYTAIIHDKTNTDGIGLVEAYWLGP